MEYYGNIRVFICCVLEVSLGQSQNNMEKSYGVSVKLSVSA